MVIAVTPRFVSRDVSRQSPPFATDCRPRFIVMSPEIWAFVNTFALVVTTPEKWTRVTCPEDDVPEHVAKADTLGRPTTTGPALPRRPSVAAGRRAG